ncbi:hypothetical protein D779_0126 [Imhoffiella purpurea]|uniref:Uncharacterized protein n=1 Tax=Imhoffiella purpurea TaxID=1249627 RepID=W9W1N9_9GAMM|nr:hypothetical protein D779_0126 [Imhoffiella purpurea]
MPLPTAATVQCADLDANALDEATARGVPIALVAQAAGIESADRQTVLDARDTPDAVDRLGQYAAEIPLNDTSAALDGLQNHILVVIGQDDAAEKQRDQTRDCGDPLHTIPPHTDPWTPAPIRERASAHARALNPPLYRKETVQDDLHALSCGQKCKP